MKDIWLIASAVALFVLMILAIGTCGVPYHHSFPMMPLPISIAEAAEDLRSSYLAYVTEVTDGDGLHVYVPVWPGIIVKANIRIAGIDTPEIRTAKCPEEKELGLKAKARLIELLPKNSPILLYLVKAKDKHGRVLANVYTQDGADVAKKLIDEGFARVYSGKGKRQGWCNEEKIEKEKEDGNEKTVVSLKNTVVQLPSLGTGGLAAPGAGQRR